MSDVLDLSHEENVSNQFAQILKQVELSDDMCYRQTLNAVLPEDAPAIESRLIAAESILRKVKFNFLELNTKERFIQALFDAKDLETLCPSNEQFSEKELMVAHEKNALKKVKLHKEQVVKDLEQLIRDLATVHESYKDKKESFQRLVQQIEKKSLVMSKEKKLVKILHESELDLKMIESAFEDISIMHAGTCDELLVERLERAKVVKEELEKEENELEQLESIVRHMEETVHELNVEIEDAKNLANKVKTQEDDPRLEYSKVNDYLREKLTTLSLITGVTIIDYTDMMLKCVISPLEEAFNPANSHEITLYFDEKTFRVKETRVLPDTINLDYVIGLDISEIIPAIGSSMLHRNKKI